jgi:hypothetical protein
MFLIAALFCGGCSEGWHCPFAPKSCPALRSVSADDLSNGKASVIGRLGKPLGTIVAIRGRALGEQNEMQKKVLPMYRVESVDGQAINPVDIQIELLPDESFSNNGSTGWIGYEDGGFEGGPRQTNGTQMPTTRSAFQARSRSFITRFHAMQSAPPEQSPSGTPNGSAGQFG